MKQSDKNLWRKNFDIKRVDFNIACETMPGFGGLNYLTVGENVISQVIWIIENLDNTATYFPKKDLRKLIQLTIKVILQNPKHIDKIHEETIKLNRKYFEYAKNLRKLNLKKLSNQQLLTLHKKLFNLQFQSHCRSLPTTWYLDSDGEDFSNYLINLVKNRVKQKGLRLDPALIFSVLTTPAQESMGQKEEKESLKIVEWIKNKPRLKRWFLSHTSEEMATQFTTLPKVWQKKILDHYSKWLWTPYTYVGPAYTLDYYLEVWRGLLREHINPRQEIKNKKIKASEIQKQKQQFMKLLGLSETEKHWFKIASDIVWLKGFRKDCYFHGFYVLDLLLAEMAKRSGLSLMQAKYLLPSELPKALAGKNFADVANQRIKFSVIYSRTPRGKIKNWTESGIKVYTGNEARAFLKKHKFEKIKIKKTNELSGTCACGGKAAGVIKIINVPEEMHKMKQGDIMLSHTTFPALVPAMKKAAAIITEDGGITCHAAIVARELQTPCVVGCKHATRILKDGDWVEVDASKGIIEKL